MKKIISLVSVSIFALAVNTQIFAQNHRWDDVFQGDTLTVMSPQEITTDGPFDNNFSLFSNKSQPPSNKIQENKYCNINVISSQSPDFIIIENAEINSSVEIYNMGGKLLLKTFVTDNKFNLNVTSIPKGIYIIVIKSKNQIISKKTAIQ